MEVFCRTFCANSLDRRPIRNKTNMTRRLLFTLIAASVSLLAAAPEEAVKQAERDWAKAIVAKDYATLEKVLADDLIYTHSNGNEDSKKSYIDKLKSGAQKYTKAEHAGDIRVKLYGNTAVVVSQLKTATDTEFTLSLLHVYVKHGNRWQMVAHQSARLP